MFSPAYLVKTMIEHAQEKTLSAWAKSYGDQVEPLIPTIGHDGGKHHSETVFEHSILVTENLESCNLKNPIPMILGALLHDVGKPEAFVPETGSMKHHEDFSAKILQEWMPRIGFPSLLCVQVTWIAQNHMLFHKMHKMKTYKLAKVLDEAFRIGLSEIDLFKMGQCDKLSNLDGSWTWELAQEKMVAFKNRLITG